MSTAAAGAAGATTPIAPPPATSAAGGNPTGAAAAAAGGDKKAGDAGAGGDKGSGSFLADGGKPADQKAGDQSAQDDAAAEIKVTLPEGVQADEAVLKAYAGVAKEAGMTSESASKVAAWFLGEQAKAQKAQTDKWAQADKTWADTVRADKDIGGARYDESMALARKTLVRFGGEELAGELHRYGLGNHPGLAKFLVSIGKAIGEDRAKAPTGGGESKPTNSRSERIQNFYSDNKAGG